MEFKIEKTNLPAIRELRNLFLQETRMQFVCDKCHYYGWSDDYIIMNDSSTAGYACVWGTDRREDRDTIFEFYLLQDYRKHADEIFRKFMVICNASMIEGQTNDPQLIEMLYKHSQNIRAEAILFEDHFESNLTIPGAAFRRKTNEDKLEDDDSDFVIELNGELAASGGFLLNYNFPYADIYMAVKEAHRGKGLGSLIVQELKKEIRKLDRVPAARCNINNQVSKATLLKAGLRICGFRLKGDLKAMGNGQ